MRDRTLVWGFIVVGFLAAVWASSYGIAYSLVAHRMYLQSANATPRYSSVIYSQDSKRDGLLRAFFGPANQVDRWLFPDRWPLPFRDDPISFRNKL